MNHTTEKPAPAGVVWLDEGVEFSVAIPRGKRCVLNLYRSKKDGKYRHLLGSVLGLTDRERFSEAAEAELLKEAVRTSYERASKVLPSKSGITKTTVMNKVHRAESGLPERASEKKKEVKK